MHAMQTRRHRWRFDLETGATKEERCDDECAEFPTIHQGFAGRKHRYVYAAIGEPGFFLFSALEKTDCETGKKSVYRFPKGTSASEAPFCPRVGSRVEDDGYVVTFVADTTRDTSECQVFDAQHIDAGPIARVRLPERICSGTHACWTAAS